MRSHPTLSSACSKNRKASKLKAARCVSARCPRSSSPAPPQGPPITRRELEILQLVAEGLSNKEIGKKLSITEGTVKNHVHNALEKLHLDNRIQAASYIVRQGLGHAPDTD